MTKADKKSQAVIKKALPIFAKLDGVWPNHYLTVPEIIARQLFEQGFTELKFAQVMPMLKNIADPFVLTILNTIRSLERGHIDKDSIPLIGIDLFDCKR